MGLYDDGKAILEFLQKSDNVDLIKKMLDVQQQSLEISNENIELKSKIKELEERLKFQEKLLHRNNAYWFEEAGVQVPICTG